MDRYIHDIEGWSFVACPTRLGSIVRTGPVTEKQWGIVATGTWIDADDALALSQIYEEVYCVRVNDYITMRTVFFLEPSETQINQLKERLK